MISFMKISRFTHSPNNTGTEPASWENFSRVYIQKWNCWSQGMIIFPSQIVLHHFLLHPTLQEHSHSTGVLIFANAMGMKWYLIVLTFISLITKQAESHFMCFCLLQVSPAVNFLFMSSAHVLNWEIGLLLIDQILALGLFPVTCTINIFSKSIPCLFKFCLQ